MEIQNSITQKIQNEFQPIFFKIDNESHKHKHGGKESHFKILIVSDKFEGLSRIERQKWVYRILKVELDTNVHALAQKTLTPKEWEEQNSDFKTPNCHTHSD